MLLKAEKKQLEQLLSIKNESGNDVDIKRAELLTEQTKIEQQQEEITNALQRMRYTKNSIEPLLPPVLKSQWQNEKALEGEDNTKQLQSILAQLTQLSEFNQRITVHESTIEITDGKPVLVQKLFLGAGIAWFVTRDGEYSGWGQSSTEGWQWHLDENIEGTEVQKAIAIFHKKQSADWVTLPINLVSSNQLSQALTSNKSAEPSSQLKGNL